MIWRFKMEGNINFDGLSARVFETIDAGDVERFYAIFDAKCASKFTYNNLDDRIKDWITHKYAGGNASSSSTEAGGFSLLQYSAYRGQSEMFKSLLGQLPTQYKIDHFQSKSPLQFDLGGTLVCGWLRDFNVKTPALREIMKTMLDVDPTCFENCLAYLARKAITSEDNEYRAMKIVLEQAQVRTIDPMENGIQYQAESVKFDKH